eukprot:TRINITY_DN9060_c0_g1_i1.p1 TRINITY_DN9060_c0_g1~~TRINITY_DN9060_c0_g1_i1.p1  ORF type:complete len:145 (-),score=11.69 TRINITY_DN9060_c0_g1_i1:174-608(-)
MIRIASLAIVIKSFVLVSSLNIFWFLIRKRKKEGMLFQKSFSSLTIFIRFRNLRPRNKGGPRGMEFRLTQRSMSAKDFRIDPKSFLSSSVPNLKMGSSEVIHNNLLQMKIGSNSGLVLWTVTVIQIASDQTRLAHPTITKNDHF